MSGEGDDGTRPGERTAYSGGGGRGERGGQSSDDDRGERGGHSPVERIGDGDPLHGTAASSYLTRAADLLRDLAAGQSEQIERAAQWVAETLQNDGLIFVAGSGHSHMLAEELFYRAGGLAAVYPLLEPGLMLHEGAQKSSSLERLEGYAAGVIEDAGITSNDLLIVASNSGRNAYPVELAQEARVLGCRTIAVTSLATAERVESRHSSGRLLAQEADLVLDNMVPYGDAATQLPGLETAVGPLSTVAGAALLNAVMVRAIELCLERGFRPDVFESANLAHKSGSGPDLERWRRRVRKL